MIKKKIFSILVLLIITIGIQMIFTDLSSVYAAEKIRISEKSKTLQVGYGMKLNIIGNNKKVKWSSADKNIATVTGTGYVTAKNVGETTINAKVNNEKYKCKIKVNQNAHVEVYNTKNMTFSGVNSIVKYYSSNTKIATVDKNGKVTGKKTGNVKIKAKVNGKKYYFNLIVDASGWKTDKDGSIYYYRDNERVTGWQYINGYKYYFKGNGKLLQYVSNKLTGKQEYYIHVNRKKCKIVVFAKDGKNGFTIPVKAMTCSVGTKEHATPTGTFYTRSKARWAELMLKSYGQYCTRIVGEVLFHSTPGNFQSIYNVIPSVYNKLGSPASHGCIRLTVGDAKWIYDNCKVKTKVTINDKSDGCKFDKPKTAKLKAGQNYDPTDPAVKKK